MHVHPTALDPGPYLVLDLSRGLDPHQARCRRCRWRSGWRRLPSRLGPSMPTTSGQPMVDPAAAAGLGARG